MSAEFLTVAAYAAIWILLTAYLLLLGRRLARLERELDALRKPPSPPPPSPSRAATP